MPQKTNLNISPYYDDFNKEDKFYKVLFKPGFPVQARELTQSQSILQNQIESFGSHIFKDGSMVIPGNINFDQQYHSVRILDSLLGIPVTLYLDQLIGLRLKGQTSGIILTIDSYEFAGTSTEINDLTIYVQYLQSGPSNDISNLTDGEQLITEESFIYGNTAVNEGETILTLVDTNASAVGSAVGISSGTYFIRGSFVDVSTDKIVLDPYSNTPSYRVGLNIDEQLVTAKDDDSLYDNARGFSNYAAPGAARLKLTPTLKKYSLTANTGVNFVELTRVSNGFLVPNRAKTEYSKVNEHLARRSYNTSGNFVVEGLDVRLREHLNQANNQGKYTSGNGGSASKLVVDVEPGKAFVKGFDYETLQTLPISISKSTATNSLEDVAITSNYGNFVEVNDPKIFGILAAIIIGFFSRNIIFAYINFLRS